MNTVVTQNILLLLLFLVCLPACEPEIIEDPVVDETEVVFGTLNFDFQLRHVWLPTNRFVRAGLHFANASEEINRGSYFLSINVNDINQSYYVDFVPGTYYYEAIIGCIAEGDSCSAAGFEGYQFSRKHTMGKFTISPDQTTTIIPDFK